MRKARIGERVRHLLEAIFAALLFGTQSILDAGIAISVMAIPLVSYLIAIISGHFPLSAIEFNIYVMLVFKEFWVGRIIALVGVVVLLLSAAQLLRNHHKGGGLLKDSAYSVVRHPQFLGIILITFGLTVMVLTNSTSSLFTSAGLWFLATLGYILIARYEEWSLSKKYGEELQQYTRKAPFLFPIKCPSVIPETIYTVLIAALLSIILLLIPYNQIRIIGY